MDVIRQKKRHKALSVSAAPSQLSQRESQGCFFDLFLPLRPLFLQCGTWYRTSSTAYGGPPSPKGKVLGVVPFNRTDSIRSAPGTAHRPSPTVSLEGGTVRPHGLYSERCLAMNHRRYIA